MTDAIVYLDFASTTPLAADVAAAMHECTAAENIYGNAASQHPAGRKS
ncbi:MAG: hypothetical protein ACKVJN_10535, partial [Woeseiales bacterium]